MQELKLIGVEDRDLILATDDGATFRLAITPTIEQAVRPPAHNGPRARNAPSPRDLQALLRSGLSVEQVGDQTGTSIEDVRRFEAPIAAELAFMVDNARSVALRLAAGGTQDEGASFGEIIDARLAARQVADARWSSWKEDAHWVVQVEFTSGGAPLDARWSFDPKRRHIAPLNDDARSISSEESPIPSRAARLRAVPGLGHDGAAPEIYDREQDGDVATEEAATASGSVVEFGQRRTAPEAEDGTGTGDLLDALRQRRGERQPAAASPEDDDFGLVVPPTPAAGEADRPAVAEPHTEVTDDEEKPHAATTPRPRGSRPSMPSWDEIVFGSRGSGDEP